MIKPIKSTLCAFSMSMLLIGGSAASVIILTTDSAIAKSDNANNGNGNANNGNGSRGNSGSNNGNRGNSGNSRSSSGALNAAHANANAQANAASNSRIGLIQAYEAAVVATSVAQSDYETALTAWAEVSDFDSDFNNYAKFADAYNDDPTGLEDELAYWEAYTVVSNASNDLTSSREIEEMALQLAANKETDAATIARLWDLLGL